jgi:MFS superfamily sulfate permease-like transporter
MKKTDAIAFFVDVVFTLVFTAETGLYGGIFVTIMETLYRIAKPRVLIFVEHAANWINSKEIIYQEFPDGIGIFKLQESLIYANIDHTIICIKDWYILSLSTCRPRSILFYQCTSTSTALF